MRSQKFDAALVKPDKPGTWTYLVVPFSAEELFGTRGQVKVRGTINGVSFRSSPFPRGDGTHYLVVNAEIRTSAGVAAGDTVRVVLRRDAEERTLEVPDVLRKAFARNKKAREAFDRLPYSHRKEYAGFVAEAKKDEARARRAEKTVQALIEIARPKK